MPDWLLLFHVLGVCTTSEETNQTGVTCSAHSALKCLLGTSELFISLNSFLQEHMVLAFINISEKLCALV